MGLGEGVDGGVELKFETMKNANNIRTLYARKHTTIFERSGVFLAGPTPPSNKMLGSWRRIIIEALEKDTRLDASMTVVAPEPESGNWEDIEIKNISTANDVISNQQIPWELQYLNLCDITAFWLPTYWNEKQSQDFDPNIGPTSRWEFGFFLQEYLKNSKKRDFIIGSPEDAESLSWAKQQCKIHGIKWHTLKIEDKNKLVAPSFIEAIADSLIKTKWFEI